MGDLEESYEAMNSSRHMDGSPGPHTSPAHAPRHSPLGQEVGLQHGRGRGGLLGQGHDVLEGDVGLGPDIHQLRLRDRRAHPGPRRPPEHLNHDGLLRRLKGVHSLLVGGPGQVLAVDLWRHTGRGRSS